MTEPRLTYRLRIADNSNALARCPGVGAGFGDEVMRGFMSGLLGGCGVSGVGGLSARGRCKLNEACAKAVAGLGDTAGLQITDVRLGAVRKLGKLNLSKSMPLLCLLDDVFPVHASII